MKKEELLIELTKIRESHANWVSGDEKRREEFAKAFNWYKTQGMYDRESEREPRTPSWTEIFVELGKLLASRNFMDMEEDVEKLFKGLDNISQKLEEINPTLN